MSKHKKSHNLIPAFIISLVSTTTLASTVFAHDAIGNADIWHTDNQICVKSDGLPTHDIGQFPNRGNPHQIESQNINFCVTKNPEKTNTPQYIQGSVGFMLNGVMIRPSTADYYDASSPRGFSRDPASGWNVEGVNPENALGLDQNNAHVDHRGLYHYHGTPNGLLTQTSSTHIGYAADGFEIHYVGDLATPGYTLKSGARPATETSPGGTYDGTYTQDYVFIGSDDKLDECNGGTLNGEYVYFATDTYPYYPRCVWGETVTSLR